MSYALICLRWKLTIPKNSKSLSTYITILQHRTSDLNFCCKLYKNQVHYLLEDSWVNLFLLHYQGSQNNKNTRWNMRETVAKWSSKHSMKCAVHSVQRIYIYIYITMSTEISIKLSGPWKPEGGFSHLSMSTEEPLAIEIDLIKCFILVWHSSTLHTRDYNADRFKNLQFLWLPQYWYTTLWESNSALTVLICDIVRSLPNITSH